MAYNTPLKKLTLVPPKSPNLPIAPVEYAQQYQDQLNNAFRLYFSQIDNVTQALIVPDSGTTADRPASTATIKLQVGQYYFDTTLNSPIYWDGTNWVSSGGSGTGTVTSVGLTLPSIFSVTGSPITTSGILAATLASQSPNTVFAGPSSGSSAAPTFRALTATDIPTINQNTTGTAATATNIAGGTATQIPYQTSAGSTSFIPAPTTATTYLMWNGSGYTWAGGGSGGGGTVTNVSALTLGTTGTDLSSSVANSGTTPVITLNVPTASATNRGALSSADWTAFNGKYSVGGALGTPSSGTLTNCTGYTASNLSGSIGLTTQVTGVLPIANGGTGVSTALAVNVKLFGATGDGITDDRTAIQNAINSISSGVVIFPAGNYLIGNNGSGVGLTLKPNVSLISFEGASVYLLAGANSIKLINYVNPSSSAIESNFVISGINLSSNSKTGCSGIYIDGNTTAARCSYIQISEMRIDGTFSNGIYLKYCANTYMSNLFISLSDIGITLDNCADSDLVNIKVQSGASYGYQVIGGGGAFDEGTRLSNCSANGQNYGMYINGADWGICTGCSFTTAPSGALVTNGTNVHWKFTGCEFAVAGTTPAFAGVNLNSGCSDFIFIGCLISLNTFGIILRGTSHIVNGCHFEADSNVDLYLDGNTRAVVNGNIFTSTGVTQSVIENASNYTNVVGNINNGTITLTGANSASANNITY